MTPLIFAAIAVAGGVGAAARLLLDGLIRERHRIRFPIGTTVINVTGSLLLGLLSGLALSHVIAPTWQIVAGTGFLGGYTTFSTASFETVRLVQERRSIAALLNSLGMLILSVAVAAGGLALGSLA